MRVATFQHVDGHAVTVFIQHVVSVQMDTRQGTLIQFASGWSIPVIDGREAVLNAFEEANKRFAAEV